MLETQTRSIKHVIIKMLSKAMCLLLIGVFLFNTGLNHAAKASSGLSDAESKAMEEKIAEIERKQKEINNLIKRSQNEQASISSQMDNVEKLLNLTQDKIATTLSLLDAQERLINETIQTIAEKEASIIDLREKFMERIRITYEGGEATYLEMIIGAKSLSDFLARIERVGSMLEYDARLISQYKQEKKSLADTKADLEIKLAEQQMVHENLIVEQAEMQQQIQKYESYISDLENNEAALKAQYQQYKKEADKENKRLQDYLKELEEKEKQKYVGGVFMWPLPITFNRISSHYGPRTLYGMYDFHIGMDIASTHGVNNINGAPIYAVNDGTVAVATWHYSYGNYVLINHGGGRSTLYAHCSKLNAVVGQKVKKGDVIGYVGSTGNSTGPHLHFEIRINGYTVDPLSTGLIVIPK